MKKILIILLTAVLLAVSVFAGAETIVDGGADRGITIHPAGENTVPDHISPVTGRDLTTLPLPEGFLGMVASGVYYPVMVQHNGYAGSIGKASPWYGSYADVIYEMPKAQSGYTRMTMLFNDYYPPYVGASRSIRVGHIWLRQEWRAMLLYAGFQSAGDELYNTSVPDAIGALRLGSSENPNVPLEDRELFNALNGFSPNTRPWTKYRYRVKKMASAYNVVWDLPALSMEVFKKDSATFPNHTWKFTDSLPEEGDSAERIYVMFNKNQKTLGDISDEDGTYIFNSMLEYDAEKNVYSRYMIVDQENPWNNAKPCGELIPTNVEISSLEDEWYKLSCDYYTQEDDFTFSNVIIQFIDMKWPSGEQPYPILTGMGNADYFMGGKHISGVWQRETYDDRTVFYGADGEEISLQRGKTLIIMMDYNTRYQKSYARELRYE